MREKTRVLMHMFGIEFVKDMSFTSCIHFRRRATRAAGIIYPGLEAGLLNYYFYSLYVLMRLVDSCRIFEHVRA